MAAPVVSLVGRWGGKLRDQNIDAMSGDDLTLQVTVLNPDGTRKNITGAVIVWGLSRVPGSTGLIVKAGSITDGPNGVFDVFVNGTGPLSGSYYHEAELTESGGAIGTVMKGRFQINEDTVNAA